MADLAAFYTGVEDPDAAVNLQFVRDLGALNAYLDDLLRSGGGFDDSRGGRHIVVAPGDTLASIAVSFGPGVTPMDILELNLTRDDIFNGEVELEIPPTIVNAEEGDTLESVAFQQGVTVSYGGRQQRSDTGLPRTGPDSPGAEHQGNRPDNLTVDQETISESR